MISSVQAPSKPTSFSALATLGKRHVAGADTVVPPGGAGGVGEVNDLQQVGEERDALRRRFPDKMRIGRIVADTDRGRGETAHETAERGRVRERGKRTFSIARPTPRASACGSSAVMLSVIQAVRLASSGGNSGLMRPGTVTSHSTPRSAARSITSRNICTDAARTARERADQV